jgi:chromosomal replication initiation ATPase DnaA
MLCTHCLATIKTEELALINAVLSASEAHDVPAHKLFGRSRSRSVVAARNGAMKALKDAGWTYAAIGRAFSKDHSSVIYSVGKQGKKEL